jgi:hypothetical protein
MESRNKKVTKSLPKYYVYCFKIVLLNIMQQLIFWKVGLKLAVKASKMAVVFGEFGRKCFTGPGNTVTELSSRQTADDMTETQYTPS